ncbi:hypothetical protein T06_11422 [Trichinella sp. T6]|nr:hypothetical protein T06_11422 [Trichinella sp. T6]
MRCESSHIGHRNFCSAVTTKADKADEEMGVHHFYHLSHWNTVQESIPRALNIRLVIYRNRRLYDFASGSGTQIASFHILASISGCTLRRILHISRCGANLPI